MHAFHGQGGDAINERQLIVAESKRGKKVVVVTFVGLKDVFLNQNKIRYRPSENVRVISIPYPQIYSVSGAFIKVIVSFSMAFFCNIIDKFKVIDAIYVRDSLLAIGFISVKRLACKTIVKMSAILEEELVSDKFAYKVLRLICSIFDKAVLAKAGRVATFTKQLGDTIVRNRRIIPPKPFVIVPPGINFNEIKRLGNIQHAFKSDKTLIGFIGSLIWWNGVDILSEAAALIKKKHPNVCFLFVGDGPMKGTIKNIFDASGIDYEITGFVSHERALQYLKTFDLLVLPRPSNPMTESIVPIKVIEAWALGVPIIVTKHKVFVEEYEEYVDIVTCEPNAFDVANSVSLVLNNKEIRNKLSMRGPEIASEFSYEIIVSKIAEHVVGF